MCKYLLATAWILSGMIHKKWLTAIVPGEQNHFKDRGKDVGSVINTPVLFEYFTSTLLMYHLFKKKKKPYVEH